MENINFANNKKKCQLVLKNANVVNVFTNEIIKGNIAINDGVFIGMGNYQGIEEIDLKEKFIVPGLIDSHLHIESSMVSPVEFAKIVLKRGTTTVIADPHEIANVRGLKAIQYMLDSTENSLLNVYLMLPSCVPATKFETAGSVLVAEDYQDLINHPRVLGLGEMMNYPGVINADLTVVKKLALAKNSAKVIDGHAPFLSDESLNAYKIAGVLTDHECTNVKEMLEKMRVGMYIALREGSATKDLVNLLPGVNKDNLRRCTFCTDDRHADDILNIGHIDNNIRVAIKCGIDPIDAIKMATLNTAECYGLKNIGAIAPGYKADFLIVDNLAEFVIEDVYCQGKLVEELLEEEAEVSADVLNTVNVGEIKIEDLAVKLKTNKVNVIKVKRGTVVTEKCVREVEIRDEQIISENDLAYLFVVERHFATKNIGKGFIEGLKIKKGAIALTIAHDSHNIIVASKNLKDALVAIEEIKKINGGIVLVNDGQVLESLTLEIAGLMSTEKSDVVAEKLANLTKIVVEQLGADKKLNLFLTLSFMSLSVIPEIKLTDKGLFDVLKFDYLDLEVN